MALETSSITATVTYNAGAPANYTEALKWLIDEANAGNWRVVGTLQLPYFTLVGVGSYARDEYVALTITLLVERETQPS